MRALNVATTFVRSQPDDRDSMGVCRTSSRSTAPNVFPLLERVRGRQSRLTVKLGCSMRACDCRGVAVTWTLSNSRVRPQASYLKESATRVRNPATLPFSTFISILVTSATRRSRNEPAAVSTALRPASSPRRLADTDHVDDPVDRDRLLFLAIASSKGVRLAPAVERVAMLTSSAARTNRAASTTGRTRHG